MLGLGCASQAAEDPPAVVLKHEAGRIDVQIDGALFTSYLYTDTIPTLKKPVLYPVFAASGRRITRGFPLDPQPGERTDHPHQLGAWLNHGAVNGLDFWNNSDAIAPERADQYGTIRHQSVEQMKSGAEGVLEVTAAWLRPDGHPLLHEETRFVFHAAPALRRIDRITTLTALDDTVIFRDSKEGMMAIRVGRALEHPSDEPDRYVTADGGVSEPSVNKAGVTGHYINSEGQEGYDVWGRRATWTMLSGVVEGGPVTVALFDHPDNVGYPTHWMARGYGLFAANPLGPSIYNEEAEALDLALAPGASTTFRYRLLIRDGDAPPSAWAAEEHRRFAQREAIAPR